VQNRRQAQAEKSKIQTADKWHESRQVQRRNRRQAEPKPARRSRQAAAGGIWQQTRTSRNQANAEPTAGGGTERQVAENLAAANAGAGREAGGVKTRRVCAGGGRTRDGAQAGSRR